MPFARASSPTGAACPPLEGIAEAVRWEHNSAAALTVREAIPELACQKQLPKCSNSKLAAVAAAGVVAARAELARARAVATMKKQQHAETVDSQLHSHNQQVLAVAERAKSQIAEVEAAHNCMQSRKSAWERACSSQLDLEADFEPEFAFALVLALEVETKRLRIVAARLEVACESDCNNQNSRCWHSQHSHCRCLVC